MKRPDTHRLSLVLSLIELVVGVLLLIRPAHFTAAIIMILGAFAVFAAVKKIIQYFRTDARIAAQSNYLTIGLLFLAAGLFCIFRPDWFINSFPAITVLYGILILVMGVRKLQLAFDLMRTAKVFWFIPLISSIISVILAVLVIANPFASATLAWIITGISLIVSAVVDLVGHIFSRRI